METPDLLLPCRHCNGTSWTAEHRTTTIRAKARTLLWWQCDHCGEWGMPVAYSPEEDNSYFAEQKGPRNVPHGT